MIRDYKKIKVVGQLGENGIIYDAVKQDKKYYLYQFQQYDEADAYNFKVLSKLLSSHILAVCQQFQQNGTKYIVTDYAQKDLLQLQTTQPNRVFPLPVALDYFAKLILALQQLHQSKLIYRNIRPEIIKLRQQNIYLYDFTFSQFCKRKERMFDIVGCQSFLAPQFFLEDGYSFQVDIWAAGVLLFFMLTNEYPFKFKNKTQKATLQQLKLSCQHGFSFEKRLQTCKNPGFIKSNKIIQDFFQRILSFDYNQRLTINRIKQHKLMSGYFPEKIDKDILQAIGEEQSNINSLLMTTFLDLRKFKMSKQIQKQQLIFDFIERCSQSLMLDCGEYIPQQIKYKAQFAILKVAMIKINNLIDVCYGKKKPEFDFNEQQFIQMRTSSTFKKVLQNIQKRQKIMLMLYKSAFYSIKDKQQDPFFNEQVPDDFNDIKISYRLALSQMFDAVKNVISKNKSDKALFRKLTQILVRMVIMHLINRIFEQQDFSKNFASYILWNKDQNIQNLDHWVHAQKLQILKQFIKQTTKNYL